MSQAPGAGEHAGPKGQSMVQTGSPGSQAFLLFLVVVVEQIAAVCPLLKRSILLV